MSAKERDRLKIMGTLNEGRLKQGQAARLLGLSTRQVRRILRRYRQQGDAGLVHRSHGVDQDRLIKELRLRGISTIAEANHFLESEYTPMCNRRFAVPAASSVDAHRRLKGYDLKAILSHQEQRVVANDYTVQYQGQKYQILRQSQGGVLRRSKVTVEHRLDGSIKFRRRGRYLKSRRITMKTPAAKSSARPVAVPLRPPGYALRPPRHGPSPGNRRPTTRGASPGQSGQFYFAEKRTFLLCVDRGHGTLR